MLLSPLDFDAFRQRLRRLEAMGLHLSAIAEEYDQGVGCP
jgi:hypothetical protein